MKKKTIQRDGNVKLTKITLVGMEPSASEMCMAGSRIKSDQLKIREREILQVPQKINNWILLQLKQATVSGSIIALYTDKKTR